MSNVSGGTSKADGSRAGDSSAPLTKGQKKSKAQKAKRAMKAAERDQAANTADGRDESDERGEQHSSDDDDEYKTPPENPATEDDGHGAGTDERDKQSVVEDDSPEAPGHHSGTKHDADASKVDDSGSTHDVPHGTPPWDLATHLPAEIREQLERDAKLMAAKILMPEYATVRVQIWSCVISANYFWVNPHTGQPAPLKFSRASYSRSSLGQHIRWEAEQSDAAGRSEAFEKHVGNVRAELARFFRHVNRNLAVEKLALLAYMLRLTEEQNQTPEGEESTMTLSQMQACVARAFPQDGVEWRFEPYVKARTAPNAVPLFDDVREKRLAMVESGILQAMSNASKAAF